MDFYIGWMHFYLMHPPYFIYTINQIAFYFHPYPLLADSQNFKLLSSIAIILQLQFPSHSPKVKSLPLR